MDDGSLSDREVAVRRRRGAELQRRGGDPAVRLTVLGSFNLDLAPPFLVEALDRRAIAADVRTGPFGQIHQELLTATATRDVVVVASPEDQLAALYEGEVDPGEADVLVTARLAELEAGLLGALDRLPGATVHLVVMPALHAPNDHVLDPLADRRGQHAVQAFADGVRALGARSPRIVVVDFDWHVRAIGLAALTDARLWYLARMRLSPAGLAALADLVARHVAASRGMARKVAVIDLDGTLWGGVAGEAGIMGVEIGTEGAGLAFADFQRELRRLRHGGTVLALASKNDPALVEELFRRRPEMPLALADFAAVRIGWQDKATSLRELAAELSLGLDAFAFFDDNPIERDWVRRALPQVAVPELPEDPVRRPAFLRSLGLFDRVAPTEADVGRAASYAVASERHRLRDASTTYDDFLRSLEQEVVIEPVDEATLPRAAQLCQRTNQFNLTTRRHTIADLEAMLARDDVEVYSVTVRDRFADSGITGLAVLAVRDDAAEIDTLLLSCRVLGRRVEDALVAFLAGRAAELGAGRLVGVRIPTERNGQTATFYRDRGFAAAGDGTFVLTPGAGAPASPSEFTTKVRVRAAAHP